MNGDDDVDYVRGPGRFYHPPAPPRRPRGLDWTNDPDRIVSLTVRCRRCTAPPNVVCRNLDAGPRGATLDFEDAPDLKKLPAHPNRVTDARRGPKQL